VRAAYGVTEDASKAATLYKPSAWPHTLGLEAFLGDSGLARLSRDCSVLEGHLWRLMAVCQPQGEGFSLAALVHSMTGLSCQTSRQVPPP